MNMITIGAIPISLDMPEHAPKMHRFCLISWHASTKSITCGVLKRPRRKVSEVWVNSLRLVLFHLKNTWFSVVVVRVKKHTLTTHTRTETRDWLSVLLRNETKNNQIYSIWPPLWHFIVEFEGLPVVFVFRDPLFWNEHVPKSLKTTWFVMRFRN